MNEYSRAILISVCASIFTLSAASQTAILFSDEFSGEAGSSFDAGKWRAELGGSGWGNEELQFYTADTANVRLDGKGNLEIRAVPLQPTTELMCWYGRCRYTSARLNTKGTFEFTYGRVEARIKLPSGAGVWPAFWMLGSEIDKVGWPNCGEIDVMEFIGKEPSTIYGTIHGPGYSGDKSISRSVRLPDKAIVSEDFHVFAVEWSETKISWFLDGRLYSTLSKKDLPGRAVWAFEKPYFLLLNFAVGGRWPGNPDATTTFPQSMLIDYVRVSAIRKEVE